jgi:hypothetical protein
VHNRSTQNVSAIVDTHKVGRLGSRFDTLCNIQHLCPLLKKYLKRCFVLISGVNVALYGIHLHAVVLHRRLTFLLVNAHPVSSIVYIHDEPINATVLYGCNMEKRLR